MRHGIKLSPAEQAVIGNDCVSLRFIQAVAMGQTGQTRYNAAVPHFRKVP